MHQVEQIEFENCIFQLLGGNCPSDIPFFLLNGYRFFWQMHQNRKRWEELRYCNSQYLIIKNIDFLVKFCQKLCTKSSELSFKNAFFSFWGGTSPLDTHLCLFNAKRFIRVLATASKIGKVGGINMRLTNFSLEMNNAFLKLLRRAHIPPQTPPVHWRQVTAPRGKQSWIRPCLSLVPFMLGLIKGNITKYIMTSVNLWLFLECAPRLEHVNKYSRHVFKDKMTCFTNASYLIGEWGQHSSTLLQGAKLNDSLGPPGVCLLEPNTYECPIRTIRTYWAEILIFDKKMSCTAQYVRMAMTLKILQVLIILPLKIYKFTKDNSTHGSFVQGQLDPRQFRPRTTRPTAISSKTTRPTAISSKDNSTHGNFVRGQLDQRQFRPYSIVAVSTRISWRSSTPLVGVTWDNSTKSNFAQIQLCPFPLYIYLN